MKKTLLFIFLVFVAINGFSQAPPVQWTKCYGGTLSDEGFDIIQTTDGGFAMLAMAASNDGDVTGAHGTADFWIVKTDSNGTIQWQKTFGGNNVDWPERIIQTIDGGYMVVGSTMSLNQDALGNHGLTDGFAIKTDAAGTMEWRKVMGGSANDFFKAVKQTPQGDFIIGGYTPSTDGDVPFNTSTGNNSNCWVLKLNAAGNVIWQKTYGGSGNENLKHLELTADGGIVFTGLTVGSTDGDITINHGDYDVWVAKLDATGTIVWQKTFGGTLYDGGEEIKQTLDGGYIIGAVTKSTNGDVTVVRGAYDIWIIKLDASGNITWQNSYGGTGEDGFTPSRSLLDIIQTADGNYLFVTGTSSNNGDATGNHGGYDLWMVRLNATGGILWKKMMGGDWGEMANSVIQTSDNSFLICGTASSTNEDVVGNHSNNNEAWVVKLGADNLAVSVFDNESVAVFPNPATSLLQFKLPNGIKAENITISDVSGKIILTEEKPTTQINVEKLPSGIYFIEVFSAGQKFQTRFIKQ